MTLQQSFLAADPELGHAAVVLQTADAFAGIAEAVLRVCLHALSMPSNALAAVLDDPDPLPNTLSSSHLQAISYSGEQSSMLIFAQPVVYVAYQPYQHADAVAAYPGCEVGAPGMHGAWQDMRR